MIENRGVNVADSSMRNEAPIGGKALLGVTPPRTVNQARRLLSKLIAALYRGEVDDVRARTLCYLLINFVTICKDTDLEERISRLENASPLSKEREK